MDQQPVQRSFGIFDRVDAAKKAKGRVDFRTMEYFVELKDLKGENDFANDFATDAEPTLGFLKDTIAAKKCLGQNAKYARHCLSFAPRLHLFSVCIRGTNAHLIRWDRAGAVISAEFDFTEESHLADFFRRFCHLTPEEKGFDTSVRDVTDQVHKSQYANARDVLD